MMAKRKQSRNRKQVKRQTRHFQLRIEHPQDAHVREVLDYARSQRREVTVIREAVTLYWALENGNLEALFETFPQYKANFTPITTPLISSGGGQLDEIKSLLERIAAQQKSDNGYPMPSASAPAQLTTGKRLTGFKALTAPVDEDDDLPALAVTKGAGHTASDNFMRMLKGMREEQTAPKAAAQLS